MQVFSAAAAVRSLGLALVLVSDDDLRFREISGGTSPAKALTFLQTEVHNVVDHDDLEESTTFRALMTYLVVPHSSKSPSVDEDDSRPRKRTKSDSSDTEMIQDETTTTLAMPCVGAHLLRSVEDPVEKEYRQHGVAEGGYEPVSGTVYAQRNEVFEKVLVYISSDGSRQPQVDMVDFKFGLPGTA